MHTPLRVLGVDPGTARTGWGVIEQRGHTAGFCAGGVIVSTPRHSRAERLVIIHTALVRIIREWSPLALSLEKAFVARNVQSALRLGEARGVALLAAAQTGLVVAEYNPTEIKTAVAGYGRAGKEQVQKVVYALLRGDPARGAPAGLPASYDATDALAAALCHMHVWPKIIQSSSVPGPHLPPESRPLRGRHRSLRNVLSHRARARLLATALKHG